MDEALDQALEDSSTHTFEDKEDKVAEPKGNADPIGYNNSNLYYFESDHLALKGNSDYHNLLRCLAVLQSQKIKAIKDLEELYDKQEVALKNPIEFVEKLQNQEDMGFPKPQNVLDIPNVNWEKYASNINMKLFQENRSTTRMRYTENESESNASGTSSSEPTNVQGRQLKANKSSTFNRFWTAEEQKKLEDLLLKYPPEEVENKRWRKIAVDLGDRTTAQVASRVQKYFIKLAQAGLPIPGRLPNVNQWSRKTQHNKCKYSYMKHKHNPSTFFASFEPPVFMLEEDESESSIASSNDPHIDSHTFRNENSFVEESLSMELKNSAEYRELMELKQKKKEILHKEDMHLEYKCDNCGMNPIVGARWHCVDCPSEVSVDFCNECASRAQSDNIHDKNHRLEIASNQSISYLDSDYQRFPSSGSNYLDPNYMACN